MATHPFRIVNVFTRPGEPLSGNPLCVFENGAGFDDAAMQSLARQFNLSETTFILPSPSADARVRIFTPSYEMPFAGHPTLGSAHVVRSLKGNPRDGAPDALRLEMKAGIVPVTAHGNRWTLTAPAPTWREFDRPVADLAHALNLTPQDIGHRPLWIKAGTEQLIVPLESEDAVRRAVPLMAACTEIRNDSGAGMIYVFAATGAARGATMSIARFFFPQSGAMLEDPATGSATANLGGWCIATRQTLPLRFEISQGEMVGRPSSLRLDVSSDGEIRVSGEVIEFAAGAASLS